LTVSLSKSSTLSVTLDMAMSRYSTACITPTIDTMIAGRKSAKCGRTAKLDASVQETFVYTGVGCSVPKDVVCVQFHPSIVEVTRHFMHLSNGRRLCPMKDQKKIGWQAFWECKSLESIILLSSVTEVGNHAFYKCSNLRNALH
jgi:hypothetical protein